MKKLNLGCGNDYRDGYLNVDIGNCKKDEWLDLENLPYPFEDNSFCEIVMQHTIEHVSRDNFPKLVEELYRITEKNGEILISAPYYLSRNAFTDFTHKNFMTEESFAYFDPTHPLRENGKIYNLRAEFEVEFRLDNDRFHPEVNIHYKLRPIK